MSSETWSTREPFGLRLQRAMRKLGPLCVGVDPHPGLLDAWGLPRNSSGLETFSQRVLEAAVDNAAALKPQVALFEAHGSAGFAVLERLLADARDAGVLTIADAKRGDIGSTMQAYAQAWLGEDSPLAADAVTLTPYLGFESLRPALDLARATGRGTFVLGLTSNPEGATVQHVGGSHSVAGAILAGVAQENALTAEQITPGEGFAVGHDVSHNNRDQIVMKHENASLGSCGAVIGATVEEALVALGLDLKELGGPILAPGFGAQGATSEDISRVFAHVRAGVLANSSRDILKRGPQISQLRESIRKTADHLAETLGV